MTRHAERLQPELGVVDCRLADTLYESLDVLEAIRNRGPAFLRAGAPDEPWSFAELLRFAGAAQFELAELGLKPGERLALLTADPCRFLVWFLGAVRGGIVPAPIALPGSKSGIPRMRAMLDAVGASAAVCPQATLNDLKGAFAAPRLLWLEDRLPAFPKAEVARASLSPGDPCFLQFTSGSTGAPRPFQVSHANLAANATLMLSHALRLRSDDLAVSWLPMHHDMGLVGMALTPLMYAVPVVFMAPTRFVRSPSLWMETIARYRATITFGPNFAFELAARKAQAEHVRRLDLSPLRVLGCGAEPINYDVLSRFAAAHAPAGLSWEAIVPCYGMAEATLGVAFDIGSGPQRLLLDRARYEQHGLIEPLPNGSECEPLSVVSCGTTSAPHEIGIFDDQQNRLHENRLGEICFRGPSVATARGSPAPTPGAWLHTGDLGFLSGGRLFVSGRQKDLVIVNGRNFFPQDIEWAAADVPGVRPNGVLAVAIEGQATEALLILFESSGDRSTQASQIAARVQARLGVTAARVCAVAPGRLPRTTSGKLRRQLAKQLWRAGEFGAPEQPSED